MIEKQSLTGLSVNYGSKTIQEFVHLYKSGQLNLEPGFQRNSVWAVSDRKKLVESIVQNYPVPSVFLYESHNNGKLEYTVLDGKQRLESVLMFQGIGKFRGQRFAVKTKFPAGEFEEELDWQRIQRKGLEPKFMAYKLQTVEVSGNLADIIDLFVRINSTGKKLTSAETRKARFYNSDFLKEASRVAERWKDFFRDNRILSRTQTDRMKHVELVCELFASIFSKGPINKKATLDSIIRGERVNGRTLKKCSQEFTATLNLVRRVFPEISATRFANSAEFYSLFLLVWEMDKNKFVLNDPRRNRQAQKLLSWFSNGVDRVRERIRKAEGAAPDERLFADYLLTVQGDTDSQANRTRRAEILKQLLGGLFEKKDERRTFTPEQRRLIWNSSETKRCIKDGCGEVLTWNNFTIDHIDAYSRGGRTSLSNAALMCRKHNSEKGNKPHSGKPRRG